LTATLPIPASRFQTGAAVNRYFDEIGDRIAAARRPRSRLPMRFRLRDFHAEADSDRRPAGTFASG
jgi:hypothetical protein